MVGLNIGAKTVLLCSICSMFGRPFFDMFTMFSLYIQIFTVYLHDNIVCMPSIASFYSYMMYVLRLIHIYTPCADNIHGVFSHKPLQGSTRAWNPLVLNMGSSSTDIGRTPSEYTTSWHQVTHPYDLLYTCGHDPMRPNIFFNPA